MGEEADKDPAALGAIMVARMNIQMSGNQISEASMTFNRRYSAGVASSKEDPEVRAPSCLNV